jgi:hypothetical protein
MTDLFVEGQPMQFVDVRCVCRHKHRMSELATRPSRRTQNTRAEELEDAENALRLAASSRVIAPGSRWHTDGR